MKIKGDERVVVMLGHLVREDNDNENIVQQSESDQNVGQIASLKECELNEDNTSERNAKQKGSNLQNSEDDKVEGQQNDIPVSDEGSSSIDKDDGSQNDMIDQIKEYQSIRESLPVESGAPKDIIVNQESSPVKSSKSDDKQEESNSVAEPELV